MQANASWTLGGDFDVRRDDGFVGKLVVAGDLSSGPATLGDPAGDLAQLMIASTGSWDILGASGIGLGSSPLPFISNSGLLEKTGGSGTSDIAPQLLNKGNVLSLLRHARSRRRGERKGEDTISGPRPWNSTTVGGGQTVDFSGGALDLIDPQGFLGKIAGFASPDTVQLAAMEIFQFFRDRQRDDRQPDAFERRNHGHFPLPRRLHGERFQHRLGSSDHDHWAHVRRSARPVGHGLPPRPKSR